MLDYLPKFPSIEPSDFKVTGEATPGYLYCSTCPTYILKYIPKVRFIFTLRNPLVRSYSEYLNKRVDKTVQRYLHKRIDNKMDKELSTKQPPFAKLVEDVAATMRTGQAAVTDCEDYCKAHSRCDGFGFDDFRSTNADGKPICRVPVMRETLPNGATYLIIDHQNQDLDNFPEITVPEDHVFVMGDNRDHSADSRELNHPRGLLGPIPLENIGGRAEFKSVSRSANGNALLHTKLDKLTFFELQKHLSLPEGEGLVPPQPRPQGLHARGQLQAPRGDRVQQRERARVGLLRGRRLMRV